MDGRPRGPVPEPVHESVGLLDAAAFTAELVLVACAARAAAGWVESTAGSIGAGIAAAGVVIAVWAVWMAPRSTRGLPPPRRALVAAALTVAIAAALIGVSLPWLIAALVSGLVLIANPLAGGETRHPSAGAAGRRSADQ